MSLLALLGVAVAKKIALGAAVVAGEKIEKKGAENEKRHLAESHHKEHLLINKRDNFINWKAKFDVCDVNGKKKYLVKGDRLSIKHHLHICDAKGKELGMVKEKLISFRSPFEIHESRPKDFIIEIAGTEIGRVSSVFSFRKRLFEVDFNGWNIVGKFGGTEYDIFSGKRVVAHIEKKLRYNAGIIVDFSNEMDELMILMMTIAIEAAASPKK
jgi:uncharacterized protein YxjI